MKIDLEKVQRLNKKLEVLHHEVAVALAELTAASNNFMFCDDCGETEPGGGFYPLGIMGPGSISGLICNPCEAKRRAKSTMRGETLCKSSPF